MIWRWKNNMNPDLNIEYEDSDNLCPDCGHELKRYPQANGDSDFDYIYICPQCGATISE